MIPIGDAPRDPEHVPWTTWALVAANVAVGIATAARWVQGVDWLDTWGFRPAHPTVTTSLTAMFLHAGVGHLLGNVWVLSIYGPNVERRLGRLPFGLLYFTAGVLSTLAFALLALGSPIPLVGASGAISGILGSYLVFFPGNTIRVLGPVWIPIRLPAWLVLAVFVAWDNFVPLVLGARDGVAHTAHLGGFFAGMALAFGVGGAARVGAAGDAASDAFEAAMQLWRQGMVVDAHHAMKQVAAADVEPWSSRAREQVAAFEQDPRLRHRR